MNIRVLVTDNYRVHGDGESVDGFASLEAAEQYARRRTRASVEALRHSGQTADSLRGDFLLFGETCTVFADGVEGYRASDEIDDFVAHPAQDEDLDWLALAPPEGSADGASARPAA